MELPQAQTDAPWCKGTGLPWLSCVNRGGRLPSVLMAPDAELKFWGGCILSLQHFVSSILFSFIVAFQIFQHCMENLFPFLNEKKKKDFCE